MFNITFLLLFSIFTSIGIYLRIKHKKNRLFFWVSAIVICGGLLGLQVILEKEAIPKLERLEDFSLYQIVIFITGLLNLFVNSFPYYATLVFYLLYNGYMKYDYWIIGGLSIPIWITALLFADLSSNYLNTTFLSFWGLIYSIAIYVLAMMSIINERDLPYRKHHFFTALTFCTPVALLNTYHFSTNHLSDYILKVIPYIVTICLLIIITLYIRDAFLGVKRKSLQTLHISTVLTQHSLKNSIGKIKLNTINIQKSLQQKKYEEIDQYVSNLLDIHQVMMTTMSTISRAVNHNLVLQKERLDLSGVIMDVIAPLYSYPNLSIVTDCHPTYIYADRLLMTECLQNICNNAVEAMKEDGIIHIKLEKRKNKVRLTITDTGQGMNKLEIHNVFEPFYSSKQRTRNHFGLGMYQAKKVIEAHGGEIDIKSLIGTGTTVMMTFKVG